MHQRAEQIEGGGRYGTFSALRRNQSVPVNRQQDCSVGALVIQRFWLIEPMRLNERRSKHHDPTNEWTFPTAHWMQRVTARPSGRMTTGGVTSSLAPDA